jgi:hypothetical protein
MKSRSFSVTRTLFAVLLSGLAVHGVLCVEPPDSLWSRKYGGSSSDEYYCVRSTPDGGYIVAGSATSFGAVLTDFWLVRVDSNGAPLWSRTYGGNFYDHCTSVARTSLGGYMMVGWRQENPERPFDIWIVETDANGDTLWTRSFALGDCERCYSVAPTSDRAYILAGETCPSWPSGNADFLLIKMDVFGYTLWYRSFGGVDDEKCHSVAQTSDGGYIMAGYTMSYGAGCSDFWLLKTDSNGDSLWSRAFGGICDDLCYAVAQTNDGGYVLAGETRSFGAGGSDLWLVRTDANGDSLWSRTFGGSTYDYCYSVSATPDGGFLLAGSTRSFGSGSHDFWIVKTDENGDSLWSRTLGGSSVDVCHSAIVAPDGGYLFAGVTLSFGINTSDGWLVKVGPERPYYATSYLDGAGTNLVLRWVAPRACTYLIYSTTEVTEIGEPPGAGWKLETSLSLPAGHASWTDPTLPTPYKRYAVIMSCP